MTTISSSFLHFHVSPFPISSFPVPLFITTPLNGDDLKDTMTGSHQRTRRNAELKLNITLTQLRSDTSELEEKIAFLEKKVSEQENIITKRILR